MFVPNIRSVDLTRLGWESEKTFAEMITSWEARGLVRRYRQVGGLDKTVANAPGSVG